jgi:hypothetical protein
MEVSRGPSFCLSAVIEHAGPSMCVLFIAEALGSKSSSAQNDNTQSYLTAAGSEDHGVSGGGCQVALLNLPLPDLGDFQSITQPLCAHLLHTQSRS